MAARTNRLTGEVSRTGRAAGRDAIHASHEPLVGERRAEPPDTGAVVDVAVYRKAGLTVSDQRPGLPGPERSPAAEQKHGFQKTGLTGAVSPVEVIPRRVEVELDFL